MGEKNQEKDGMERQRIRKRTAESQRIAKGGKNQEKDGMERQRIRKRTAESQRIAKGEKTQEKDGMEIQRRETQRKVWMSQLTTSFGVLIFHWSKFWKNVLRTRSKIEKILHMKMISIQLISNIII